MDLIKFGVKSSLISNLMGVFFFVAGIYSAANLNREAFPTFSLDIVMIKTVYPGSSPEEVEKLITDSIEEELKTVSDIDRVQSISTEGLSIVYAVIDPDAPNKPQVVTDIGQAMNRIQDFPADLEDKPLVTELKLQDTPIIEVTVGGDLPRAELQRQAEILEKKLEDIDVVSKVDKNGWRNKEIWVELDAYKMKALSVSLEDVSLAIKARNINVPGGTIDTGKEEILIRTNAEFTQAKEIDEIVVRSNASGKDIQIKDVGKARETFKDQDLMLRVNGKESISLVVVKKQKGDAITMVEEVKKVVEEFKKQSDPRIEFSFVNDISIFVKNRLGVLLNNGIFGFILVMISLFIFMNPSLAFWTSMDLPVAMGMSLWIMSLFGITINLISMFAIIIVIGMLVDDSIVVAENIFEKMEAGMDPHEAAIQGTKEVAMPVLMTVLVTILFFLPLAMMSGIFGKWVRPIPIVIGITLLASVIECFLILPSHIAEFGRVKLKSERTPRFFERVMDRFKNWYGGVISWTLSYAKTVTFGAFVFVFAGIFLGFKIIPKDLFPSEGMEIFFVRAKTKVGTSLEETARQFEGIENILQKFPKSEVKDFVTMTGLVQNDPGDPLTERGSHVGQIVVYLTPERKRERDAQTIIAQVRSEFSQLSGFERVWIDEVVPGPPEEKPISIRVRGEDYAQNEIIADALKQELNQVPGLIDIADDYEPGKKELRVNIKEKNIARSNLTPFQVAKTTRAAFEGEIASVVREKEIDTNVVVRLNETQRGSEQALQSLLIKNPFQFYVPMSNLIETSWGSSAFNIQHFDEKRVLHVTAGIEGDKANAAEVYKQLKGKFEEFMKKFPGYDVHFGGENNQDTEDSLASLVRASLLMTFLAYILLAGAFNSLMQPLLMLLTIPFGLLSAMIALYLRGEPLSFLAFLGIVGLAGVTVNNAIILVEFINVRRRDGLEVKAAIIDACKKRFRPVFLTAITTVVSLFPADIGIGGADPFIRPMALVLSWGLTFGTVLTLVLIPCGYLTLDQMVVGTGRLKAKIFGK